MRLSSILSTLDTLAPLRYAESWDNVGLLVGDPNADVTRVLVTVDYAEAVAAEARSVGANLVVAYHPPMFSAVKRVPHDALWAEAVRDRVALYSMHTALDVAPEGTNDFLADVCGVDAKERRPLRAFNGKDSEIKLVTFLPESDLERVSHALFDAGAGRIGAYTHCSFRSPGTGTFFGQAGTNPTVGQSGKLETAPEMRLETVVPIGRVSAVVAALRASHSYEEPAFDLVRLASAPEGVGLGRVGSIEARPRTEIIERVKKGLGLEHVLVAGPTEGSAERIAVAAGAGGELADDAMKAGADVFVTGELRHHDALALARRGVMVVAALHSNSERAAVRAFSTRLAKKLSGVEVRASEHDADPFRIV
ncbi:Nif3-like dinuclear metal center hexameric protein [Labilithrix luteola]|nr:Nif3-like dinuclear metal center hexameric protein [Labilithrix luteola]